MSACSGCGACCRGLIVEVYGPDPTPRHLTKLDRPWARYSGQLRLIMRSRRDGRCIALREDDRCSIYDSRPTVYRLFQKGEPHCRIMLERHRPDVLEVVKREPTPESEPWEAPPGSEFSF